MGVIAMEHVADNAPLKQLDEWDDFVATRYRQGKSEEEFRNYKAEANPTVTEFYRQNHARQTFDFVLQKKTEYCSLNRGKKSIWEMAEYLNTLVDDSDPDTDLTQIEHLLQTAEAIRKIAETIPIIELRGDFSKCDAGEAGRELLEQVRGHLKDGDGDLSPPTAT